MKDISEVYAFIIFILGTFIVYVKSSKAKKEELNKIDLLILVLGVVIALAGVMMGTNK